MFITSTESSPMSASASEVEPAAREFLAFKLGHEEYGIDILRVQEIRSFELPTRVAHSPAHMLGVINLRGTIVPVIDLRLKFQLPRKSYDEFTVVIVLRIGSRTVGMVVDGVSDVITLTPDQWREAPSFDATIDSEHLLAIGSIGERMLILLDIERLMRSPEMGLFDPDLT
jgi:purine-binding chemotaxis protein CheW